MHELGDFLKARRARLSPDELGVAHYGARRVPGLRREEVAALAGVSVDYYTRLEQGRVNASAEVLDAVARALALQEPERRHLHALAHPPRRRAPATLAVPPTLRQALARMDQVPAYVMGPRTEVLAWNALAEEVVFPFGQLAPERRSLAWIIFTEPLMRERHLDWAKMAHSIVGYLRADVGRDPSDPRLAELVGELAVRSPEFAKLWARHHVREKTSGHKFLHHPAVGELELDFDTLRVAGAPDIALVLYSAPAGSPGETALQLLATLRAGTSAPPQPRSSPAN